MKFLCLICAEKVMEWMPAADAVRLYDEYRVFTDDVRVNAQLVDVNRLVPPTAARTLRVRDGQVTVTDGPFAETKEVVGGYYVLEAADLDAAVRIAARIPGARFGCVEVRPIAGDAQTRRALSPPAAPV
jgi:hypothetical protein